MLLFAIDAAALFIFLPIFERMWGATETACFFFSCVASAALILLISLVACFALTLKWEVLQVCTQLVHVRAEEFSCQLNSRSTLGFRPPLVVCSSSLLKYTPKTQSSASQANICRGLTRVPAPLFVFRYHPLKQPFSGLILSSNVQWFAACSGLSAEVYSKHCSFFMAVLLVRFPASSDTSMQFISKQIALSFDVLLVYAGGTTRKRTRFDTDAVAGWIYLRFFQVRGDYIVRGDASEVIARIYHYLLANAAGYSTFL